MASANLLNLYFFLIALTISELHNYNGVISTPQVSINSKRDNGLCASACKAWTTPMQTISKCTGLMQTPGGPLRAAGMRRLTSQIFSDNWFLPCLGLASGHGRSADKKAGWRAYVTLMTLCMQ